MAQMNEEGEGEVSWVLPAEYVGEAGHDTEGNLTIGTGDKTVTVNLSTVGYPGWWKTQTVGVYVRRYSDDLSICEIHMTRHDGLAQEALDEQNRQADEYPLGPKEYWRGETVGKYTTKGGDADAPSRLMTDEDFEDEWDD